MPTFERYELREEGNQKNVILYLSRNETEFGKEPGVKDKEEQLSRSVRDYVRSKFPNMKLNTAKVMMGTVLIASVPLSTNAVMAATGDQTTTPTATQTQTGTTTTDTTTAGDTGTTTTATGDTGTTTTTTGDTGTTGTTTGTTTTTGDTGTTGIPRLLFYNGFVVERFGSMIEEVHVMQASRPRLGEGAGGIENENSGKHRVDHRWGVWGRAGVGGALFASGQRSDRLRPARGEVA